MSVERIIGIDFGTSTSLVKVKSYRDGKPVDGDPTSTQAVEFDNGRVTAPTLIRFAGEAVYFGQEAIPPKRDSELCSNFKLDLQSPDAAARAKAQELTRKYFRYLYEQYSGQSMGFGQFDTERTLVSYPAKWAKETREFMLQAARDAGFKNVGGMDEPTAALYTVMVQESKRLVQQGYLTAGKAAYVLMIDMGAGTTDLALCKYTPGGRNRIIDTWPPAESAVLFGGREMDELLLQYLTEYLKKCDMPDRMIANLEKNSLEDCKGWKENTVSSALARNAAAEDCAFVAPLLMMIGEAPPPFPAIDRAVLERYCKDYIGRYAELIAGAMAHARQADPDFSAGDLSLVVLTGGHSQWYFAKDMLCCSLPGYEGGVGVRLSADQVVALKPPQHTVSSGLVFSVQNLAPVEEPKPEQRRQADAEPVPPRPEQEQAGYTLPKEATPQVKDGRQQSDPALEQARAMARQEGTLELSGKELLQLSIEAKKAGNQNRCFKYDLLAAEAGSAEACIVVSRLYENGVEGVITPNLDKALEYAEKCIPLWEPVARARVTQIKEKMFGKAATASAGPAPVSDQRRDYVIMPIEELMEAANGGDPQAQYWLADRYQDGRDVPEDPAQADMWYKRAFPQLLKLAEQGDTLIQYYVAGMYRVAEGVEENLAEAFKWYRRSAEQGHHHVAQYTLGNMYENGEGVEKDIPTAIMWYEKAAAGGDKDAKKDLKRLQPDRKTGFLRGLFK